MDWIEITIQTSAEGIEPVTGMMLMEGISGWVIDDPRDIQRYLEGQQARRWDYVDDSLLRNLKREAEIRVYVGDNGQGQGQLQSLRSRLDGMKSSDARGVFGSLDWRTRKVKEEDWANNWKAFFKPFPVGRRLVVKPSWETVEDTEGRVVLEIDPGSSFGTGQHHTTKMCLEMIEKYIRQGDVILDVGCGSGILMAAGLLLGAAFAAGVDVEEHSVRTARENILLNRINGDRFALYCGDLTADPGLRKVLGSLEIHAGQPGTTCADLLVVNIVADVILRMAPYFVGLLAGGGRLLVSGVIDSRRDEVLGVLMDEGFALEEEQGSGEWKAFVLRLRENPQAEPENGT
ncbi:MAG: 50S ribosomal protein L11 methyltransferase [Clostridiales bacterium]|nr:50S ribosomal protein L11 methyltransferase [Clostridiales bacterium]